MGSKSTEWAYSDSLTLIRYFRAYPIHYFYNSKTRGSHKNVFHIRILHQKIRNVREKGLFYICPLKLNNTNIISQLLNLWDGKKTVVFIFIW